ncbi:MAG: hypothetical protein NUV67_06235 [archaeon]|nr:hypothetical protein [archaeon]
MKKIILVLAILSVLLFSGCAEPNPNPKPNPGPILDPDLNGPPQNGEDEKIAFIAVHMEAGPIVPYVRDNWPVLEELVELADSKGFKLTLQFNPQWGVYILDDPGRLALLRSWEANGHEIALHHHGLSHNNWNGYTNEPGRENDPRYKGTITEMMAIMNRLPADGQMITGSVTDADTDWPRGMLYNTSGGARQQDLLSSPRKAVWNGSEVTIIQHRMYAVGTADAAPLSEIEEAYQNMDGQIMGIVFHVHDYGERGGKIEELFDSLGSNGIEVKSVKSVLSGGN